MDYTGKKGVGKRYLDEYGNFRPVTELPEEIQEEMRVSSKELQEQQRINRMAKGGQDSMPAQLVTQNSNEKALLSIIEQQTALINKLNTRLDGIEAKSAPQAEAVVEEEEVEKPMTKKESLLEEAKDLGIVCSDKNTIKELEEMIAAEVGESDGKIGPSADDMDDL